MIRDRGNDDEKKKRIVVSLKKYLNETLAGNTKDVRSGSFTTIEIKRFYQKQIEYFRSALGNSCTFLYNFEHLREFESENGKGSLARELQNHYLRFGDWMRCAAFEFLKEKTDMEGLSENHVFAGFVHVNHKKMLRELKCEHVGRLVSITGTVTRASEVRPELLNGVFVCSLCGTVSDSVKQRFVFTRPLKCRNPQCYGVGGKFQLRIDDSQLVNFQKIRIQESTDEIPSGTIPRTMDVIVRNDMIELPKPGDKMEFIGCLVVVPDLSKIVSSKVKGKAGTFAVNNEDPMSASARELDSRMDRKKQQLKQDIGGGISGLKVLGVRDMSYKLCFLSHFCSPESETASTKNWMVHMEGGDSDPTLLREFLEMESGLNWLDRLTQKELLQIQKMKDDKNIISNLVKSIAPTIFGYSEIKKGILVQMVGGVNKTTLEGIKLRGDVNICIVGDPGTAKSQFLKYVSNVLPRAVYTSGKASSSAGLTASVVKRNDTGEFAIEAGALMLADNGICCIDEFDKMNVTDQVAIHEAMEQQTISIAKAGIRATLHARTAILAAANPVGGKYDKSKTLMSNIGKTLSPAIISRFDLFFVVSDSFNDALDRSIAEHICQVHAGGKEMHPPPYRPEHVRLYVKYVQNTYHPQLMKDSRKLLARVYTDMRQRDKFQNHSFRIGVRQLESLVRISEAIARLQCDEKARPRHVDESIKLLATTMKKLEVPDVQLEFDDTDKYVEMIRKQDRKKRNEVLNRIRKNMRECQTEMEDDEKDLDEKIKHVAELQKKLKEYVTKERELSLTAESERKTGAIEELQEKIGVVRKEISVITTQIKKMKERVDESKSKYEKVRKEEENLLNRMSEAEREELEKTDDDAEIVENEKKKRKKKKRKTGHRVSLSQESYQRLHRCFMYAFKELKENEKGRTVRYLVDRAKKTYMGEKSLEHDEQLNQLSEVHFEKIVKQVITRLVTKDNVLIDLDMGSEEGDKNFDDHVLCVNPNYDVSSI